jgi:hypothetical protein
VLIWCYIDVVCETMSIMYILFFSALARELNEPARARKRAEPS